MRLALRLPAQIVSRDSIVTANSRTNLEIVNILHVFQLLSDFVRRICFAFCNSSLLSCLKVNKSTKMRRFNVSLLPWHVTPNKEYSGRSKRDRWTGTPPWYTYIAKRATLKVAWLQELNLLCDNAAHKVVWSLELELRQKKLATAARRNSFLGNMHV